MSMIEASRDHRPHRKIPRDWENPSIFAVNKRKPHVPLRSFTDPAQAFRHFRLLYDALSSQSLSSPSSRPRRWPLETGWKFRLYDAPESVPDGFEAINFDCEDWDLVRPTAAMEGGISGDKKR